MMGSEGTSNGSFVMKTTESASPGTSTPSQNERVPSNTARSVDLNDSSRALGEAEVGDFIGGGLVDPGLFNELLDHFFHVRESTGLGYSDEDFTCCNASSKRSATPK